MTSTVSAGALNPEHLVSMSFRLSAVFSKFAVTNGNSWCNIRSGTIGIPVVGPSQVPTTDRNGRYFCDLFADHTTMKNEYHWEGWL